MVDSLQALPSLFFPFCIEQLPGRFRLQMNRYRAREDPSVARGSV